MRWSKWLDRPAPELGLLLYRWLLLAVLPYETLTGYGDLRHFFQLAQLPAQGGGLPFLGHWIEFPPLFPFLSLAVNAAAGGSEHVYVYLLAGLMAVFDAANLCLFIRILGSLNASDRSKVWCYVALLALPAIGWWTFEPLGVFWLLMVVLLVLESRTVGAGIIAGVGLLTKWLPGLGLLVAWPRWPWKRTLLAAGVALIVALLVWLPLLASGGQTAWDSLRSQSAKPAWETPWALLEGNRGTGTFGEAPIRLLPLPSSTPSVVPRWLPSAAAAVLGAILAWRARRSSPQGALLLMLVALVLVFLASPGWSPQWLAYLVPMILLGLPQPRSALYSLALTAVVVLEWPVLLSRGRFDLLWITVLVRTLLLVLLGIDAWQRAWTESPTRGVSG